MTEKQKTQYMRMGLAFAGITASDCTIETIWRIYEEVKKKKGDYTVRDSTEIEAFVKDKHKKEVREEENLFKEIRTLLSEIKQQKKEK